ncbi:MAG: hypothetical protein [Olavius algarvensis Delta 4 endosymbiont]|nr:MAG: hypothetical protein [Olavius algarvensis Delta 4 endosymbiont]
MDFKDIYKLVDANRAQKRTGYRVQFQQKVDAEIVIITVPPLEEESWPSDVATWRFAWRIAEARLSDPPDIDAGDLVNITVVDDQGRPVKYYATNQLHSFNTVDLE